MGYWVGADTGTGNGCGVGVAGSTARASGQPVGDGAMYFHTMLRRLKPADGGGSIVHLGLDPSLRSGRHAS